jgi:outer membrane protein insertion porin family
VSNDIYDWEIVYSDFTKDSYGDKIKVGYPVGQFSRVFMTYMWEHGKVKDVASTDQYFILNQQGIHVKGAIGINPVRDTTDHPFLPTRGSVNSFSVEYASKDLGGDANYASFVGDSGWYFPLFGKLVGYVHFRGGYMDSSDTNKIPIYDRFFLGGINSLRAFNFATVGPSDQSGNVVGGTTFAVVNAEFLFPILEKYGMRGVLFYDAGNDFDPTIVGPNGTNTSSFSINKMRQDCGPGIRWNSPLGPIRVEWGYNLDRQPGDDRYNWQFSMGAFF